MHGLCTVLTLEKGYIDRKCKVTEVSLAIDHLIVNRRGQSIGPTFGAKSRVHSALRSILAQ